MSSNNFFNLDSVGSVLNTENGLVYPMLADGDFDIDNDDGVYLEDIDGEWVAGLSSEDVETVLTTCHNLNLEITPERTICRR